MIRRVQLECDAIISASPLLAHFDAKARCDSDEIFEYLFQDQERQDTEEWWAVASARMADAAANAMRDRQIGAATWAVGMMQACRAMLIYKQSIEASMWRGYSLGLMQNALSVWTRNKEEPTEEFWQRKLTENVLILSQLFAFPVVVLKGKAYVGGKGIDNSGGKLADFLLTNQLSQNAALVEIKTPMTKLLEPSEYRAGVFPVSNDLSGAISQVLSYKENLMLSYLNLRHNSSEEFNAFNPQCLVIAGNFSAELVTRERRRSFELFRTSLKDVQVITYDELFAKLETLLKLLGS